MKIKALTAAVILSIAAAARGHSFGLGAQFNFRAESIFVPGAALVVSASDITHLAINWYLDLEKVNTIGFTWDVCPLNLPLINFNAGTFNFTLGGGIFANMAFTSDIGINGGLRVPVGFNVLLGRVFEVYTHVAPSFGLNFLPNMGLSDPFFPVALGVQLWFR